MNVELNKTCTVQLLRCNNGGAQDAYLQLRPTPTASGLDCNLQLAAAEANTTIRLMSPQLQNLFLGPSLHLLIVEIASIVQRDKQEDIKQV